MTRFLPALALLALSCAFPAQAEQDKPLTRIEAMTSCDRLAADPYDRALPEGLPTVRAGLMEADKALAACLAAVGFNAAEPRFAYQAGRAARYGSGPDRFATARAQFEKAAGMGYAAASRALAELLQNPLARLGEVPDDVTITPDALKPSTTAATLKLLEMAAGGGDLKAKVMQGQLLLSGEALLRDPVVAEQLFRAAAEAGEALGDVALGDLFAHGPSARRDYGQARAAFERAMDRGEPLAFVKLGEMAEFGLGEIVDLDKARRLYRKAMELGSIEAMTALAKLGDAGRPPNRRVDLAMLAKATALGDPAALIAQAEAEAFARPAHDPVPQSPRETRRMAVLRHLPAMVATGRLTDLAGNAPGALQLFALAHRLGSAEGAAAEGSVLVRMGRDADAEPILREAAERGNDDAALRYAELLIRQFRQQEAEGWFQLAAYANVDGARRALGTHYKDGTIGRRSIENAKAWYRRAIEGGDEGARIGFAAVSLEQAAQSGDYDEARRLYSSIPEGVDFAEAQWQLGLMAMNGLGQEVDMAKARGHFEAAAAKSDVRAMGMLAALYEGDRLGPPDLSKAREWYVKAAELADPSAMFRLAAMEADRLPAPDAAQEAVKWLEGASHLGMAEAKLALAAAYRHGIGAPQDDARALRLLSELDAVGDFAGRLNFARALELGVGGEKRLMEARARYQALFDEAQTPLAQIGLARIAEVGTADAPADPSLALYLYSAVADTVNDEASAAVIRLKLDRALGFYDETGAFLEMRKGLTVDLPLTLESLARHACPQAMLKEDCAAAIRRLEEMSDYGVLDAKPALARLLEDGVGLAKDAKRASDLKAAEALMLQRLYLTSQFIMFD